MNEHTVLGHRGGRALAWPSGVGIQAPGQKCGAGCGGAGKRGRAPAVPPTPAPALGQLRAQRC